MLSNVVAATAISHLAGASRTRWLALWMDSPASST
jgi:hypothetical protein